MSAIEAKWAKKWREKTRLREKRKKLEKQKSYHENLLKVINQENEDKQKRQEEEIEAEKQRMQEEKQRMKEMLDRQDEHIRRQQEAMSRIMELLDAPLKSRRSTIGVVSSNVSPKHEPPSPPLIPKPPTESPRSEFKVSPRGRNSRYGVSRRNPNITHRRRSSYASSDTSDVSSVASDNSSDGGQAHPASQIKLCQRCEEHVAIIECADCGLLLCVKGGCDEFYHSENETMAHERKTLYSQIAECKESQSVLLGERGSFDSKRSSFSSTCANASSADTISSLENVTVAQPKPNVRRVARRTAPVGWLRKVGIKTPRTIAATTNTTTTTTTTTATAAATKSVKSGAIESSTTVTNSTTKPNNDSSEVVKESVVTTINSHDVRIASHRATPPVDKKKKARNSTKRLKRPRGCAIRKSRTLTSFAEQLKKEQDQNEGYSDEFLPQSYRATGGMAIRLRSRPWRNTSKRVSMPKQRRRSISQPKRAVLRVKVRSPKKKTSKSSKRKSVFHLPPLPTGKGTSSTTS